MYELINTSVPNGLVAGTHGFATVAMTKGMPDAIRTRVESFCAYPHRTSAHDQSYFRDNPVNWFHLQIPSGDHVVGRTAPADFDYTGRTNRIAHTLVFGAKEMSIVGGAYILGAESRRFLAEWSGDPKYLTVDKLTAGRLGLADIPKNTTPTNWTATFGDDGAKYARRFAALVAKNVSGGNKCVYFKTSTAWDGDGTRLLGLFSDLINLLPEGIRPFVTFSTFAACVPNGVACHLRGIYDKDRPFEIASATQPWVDCEHGRIVHEELLPEEGIGQVVTSDETSDNHKPHIGAIRNENQEVNQGRRIDFTSSSSSASSNLITKLLVSIVLILGVVLGWAFWFYNQQEKRQREADDLLRVAQEEQKREQDRGEAERARIRREKAEADLGEKERQLQKQKEKEAAEQKREADQKEMEKQQRIRDDAAAKAKANAEVAKRIADEKARRMAAEEKRKATIGVALSALPVPLVKPSSVSMEEFLNEELATIKVSKSDLTNADAVVVWYWDGKDVRKTNGFSAYGPAKKSGVNMFGPRSLAGGPKKTELVLQNPEVGNSPWMIWQIVNTDWKAKGDPSSKMAIWVWRDDKTDQSSSYVTFKPNGLVDVECTLFGAKTNEAAKVWQKTKQQLYFIVKFESFGASKHPKWWASHMFVANEGVDVKSLVRKERIAKLCARQQKLQLKIKNAARDRVECEAAVEQARTQVQKAKEEYAKWENMTAKEKNEKFGQTTQGDRIIVGVEKILAPYLKELKKTFVKASVGSLIKDVEKEYVRCRHPEGHVESHLKTLCRSVEKEITSREEDLVNVKYRVIGVLTEIPKNENGNEILKIGINLMTGKSNDTEDD